jgi:hypothetical protein
MKPLVRILTLAPMAIFTMNGPFYLFQQSQVIEGHKYIINIQINYDHIKVLFEFS